FLGSPALLLFICPDILPDLSSGCGSPLLPDDTFPGVSLFSFQSGSDEWSWTGGSQRSLPAFLSRPPAVPGGCSFHTGLKSVPSDAQNSGTVSGWLSPPRPDTVFSGIPMAW